MLTVAQGGLSGSDLQELTGSAPLWEIEKVLHTVSGRTFTRRVSSWQPPTRPLRCTCSVTKNSRQPRSATSGDQRMVGYRDRLHTWADTYLDKRWPPGTPDYILSGYWRLLHRHQRHAPDRRTALPTSLDTSECLISTGGDAAALNEVRTALDLITEQASPNLAHPRLYGWPITVTTSLTVIPTSPPYCLLSGRPSDTSLEQKP